MEVEEARAPVPHISWRRQCTCFGLAK